MTEENVPSGEPEVVQVQDSETATGGDTHGDGNSDQSRMRQEIAQSEHRLKALRDANSQKRLDLMQMGAAVDPSYLVRLRVDSFISFIFARIGNTSPEIRQLLSLQFEVAFEEKVAEKTTEAESEVRKAVLGFGGNVTEDQLKSMWLEQQRKGNGGSWQGFGP